MSIEFEDNSHLKVSDRREKLIEYESSQPPNYIVVIFIEIYSSALVCPEPFLCPTDVSIQQIGHGDRIYPVHFVLCGDKTDAVRDAHIWRDSVPPSGQLIIHSTDDIYAFRRDANLLVGLSECGFAECFITLFHYPAREGDLSAVMFQISHSFCEDNGAFRPAGYQEQKNGGKLRCCRQSSAVIV